MVRLTILALVLTTNLALGASTGESFQHETWDQVLKTYVNELGEVDYAALKADRGDLDHYVQRLGDSSPDNHPELFPTKDHELAYWLNAYNALTIQGVVDNYPTKSVRKLGRLWSFFRKKDYTAGGKELSLDDIEHQIIRKRYEEPRIHFAIVCASVSCPRLSRDAFMAETLDSHLERLAREFINERRSVTIDPDSNVVTVSKIFDWFKEDFEKAVGAKGGKAVLEYISRFVNEENRRLLESLRNPAVKYHKYNWLLNKPGSLPS